MTKPMELPLESMSAAEKVQLMEAIWSSLCKTPSDVQTPEWHREILAERTRRLEQGEATVSKWPDAKDRLLNLDR